MVLCAFNTMLVTQPKKRADILRCHHCMVYPWKDVCETSPEILYWWCVTTQMALLIGHAMWEIASTNQRNHTDLGSDESSVWNFCACFSGIISQGNQWWRRKMSTVCSGCSLLRSYFGLITKCYCVPPQGKGRSVAWRNKHGCVGLRLMQHQSSFMCNLKITNGNNLVLRYLPVRMTVPENSLQSFLTMANPIPLFAPVTCGIEFIFAKL